MEPDPLQPLEEADYLWVTNELKKRTLPILINVAYKTPISFAW